MDTPNIHIFVPTNVECLAENHTTCFTMIQFGVRMVERMRLRDRERMATMTRKTRIAHKVQ